jgi:hypothetical protein
VKLLRKNTCVLLRNVASNANRVKGKTSRETAADLRKCGYRSEAIEKHERGRIEDDLTGAWPAVVERRRACRRRSNLPAMSRRRDAAAASSAEMSSVGVGGEQVDAGGDAVPLFFGPAMERGGQRNRGGRRWCGVKR